MGIHRFFKTYQQFAEAVQPGMSALHHPAPCLWGFWEISQSQSLQEKLPGFLRPGERLFWTFRVDLGLFFPARTDMGRILMLERFLMTFLCIIAFIQTQMLGIIGSALGIIILSLFMKLGVSIKKLFLSGRLTNLCTTMQNGLQDKFPFVVRIIQIT